MSRPVGSKNRIPVEIKAMVETALTQAGGAAYLLSVARKHPNVFCALVAKLMPTNVDVSVAHSFREILSAAVRLDGPRASDLVVEARAEPVAETSVH